MVDKDLVKTADIDNINKRLRLMVNEIDELKKNQEH
jgi:hypothetical protein